MAKNTFWTDDWLETQRRYWDQWTQMQQQAMGIEQPPKSPWEAAMDHWRQAVETSLPDPGREFFDRLVDQGKAFFGMAESFGKGGLKDPTEAWQGALGQLMKSFSESADQAGRGASGFWEMPLDNWQRMASALSPVPGDMLRGMPHPGMKENLDRMLGAPGLGYTRESQEQYQTLFQALLDYQEALAEYTLFFSNMGEKAATRLVAEFGDRPIESARELYDSWVQCCEAEYAEQVMTPEYARMHGQLVNALMQVKHRWGELVNEYLSALDIPNRDDLRTLQRRVQEQRREIRALQHDLAEIRAAVENAQPPVPAAPSRPVAKRKPATAAARKKAPPRKKKAAPRKKTTATKA